MLEIGLPFSWLVFFLMAVVFSIAKVVYTKWCPWFIKHFDNIAEFDYRYPGVQVLTLWTHSAYFSAKVLPPKVRAQYRKEIDGLLGVTVPSCITDVCQLLNQHASKRADIFVVVRSGLNSASPVALLTSYLTFKVGILLFLVVLGQNVWSVLKMSLLTGSGGT